MPRKILVVDDDPINREILAEMLDDDFETRYAESGMQAIEIAAAFRPDLTLLDIMMPGMDGYEACRHLRAAHPYSKIILVSAKAMTKERLKGYESGADDYVTKPFDPFELVAKLQVFLRLGHVEELDRRKSDLLTILAHEMRTPLTMILTTAQLLEEMAGGNGGPDLKPLHRVILEGGERLNSLVEKTVRFFDVGFGPATFPDTPIDLASILRSAALALPDTPLRVQWDLDPQLCIFGLERDMQEAFLSMLRRSLEQPGIVQVNGRIEPAKARIVIEADAASVDPKEIALWFSPFEVADVQHHSRPLDLDLPIAAAIVRRHGGNVEAAVDGGRLKFVVTIPRRNVPDCGCAAA